MRLTSMGNAERNHEMKNFFAITGGAAAGKTSLINALVDSDYQCAIESVREILQVETALGKDPTSDPKKLAWDMLKADIKQYEGMAGTRSPVFFDRSIIDSLLNLSIQEAITKEEVADLIEKYPYSKTAFFAPYWPEIYCNDEERLIAAEESEQMADALKNWYVELGFTLVEIPKVGVAERVQFVVDTVTRIIKEN